MLSVQLAMRRYIIGSTAYVYTPFATPARAMAALTEGTRWGRVMVVQPICWVLSDGTAYLTQGACRLRRANNE